MNKMVFTTLSLFFMVGCATFNFSNKKVDVYTFNPTALHTNMKLGAITIEPAHSINGIEVILPEIVKSVANENSITLNEQTDSDLIMDIYLHRKSYLKDFKKYESVTLMLKITNSDGMVSNTVYTRDSQTPLDSFAKVYEIFQDVMSELEKECTTIQKEILKLEETPS